MNRLLKTTSRNILRGLLLLAIVSISACNPYSQFYQGESNARSLPGYIPSNEPVKIYSSNNFDQDARELIRRGYRGIGESSFNGVSGSGGESQIRAQAQKIGAHAVLVSNKYSHTISGSMPLTVPTTSTSYSTGSATAYGPSGAVTAYGSGTTTTYGTRTTYMPYAINRSDYDALFFAKSKSRIGLFLLPIDDMTRRKIQSNYGLLVDVVCDDTPAYAANILPGDILTKINGTPVRSVDSFQELIKTYTGKTAVLTLNRDGSVITKTVPVRSF